MRGRKTQGPQLVQNLDGSEHAKQRLEVILRTLTGELTIAAASELLGIRQARFNVLRRRALQAAVGDLEPRRRGRPARQLDPDQQQCQELQDRIIELQQELEIAAVRAELATILPQRSVHDSAVKKTTQRPTNTTRKKKKTQRRKPPQATPKRSQKT